MTTNTELIARLRLGASISRERKLNQGYEAVADEAADAIQALESDNKFKDELLTKCSDECFVLTNRSDALQAQLAAAQGQKPFAWARPDAVDASQDFRFIKIADFTLPLYAAPIPQQPETSRLPLLSEAFRTTESNGASADYRMVFKFKDLASLHSADDEWRKFKGAV